MCGRYTLTKRPEDIHKLIPFRGDTSAFKPRYNVAPTQRAPVVTMACEWKWMRWGLIPAWATEASIGAKMINARSETVGDKPAFKRLLPSQRCLVPADGFYEWQVLARGKQPHYFQVDGGALFCFAGLWDLWRTPAGETWETFTLLTTRANGTVQPIHHRMPVVLTAERIGLWIQEGPLSRDTLDHIRQPLSEERIGSYPVQTKVNRALHDAADCIEPLGRTSAAAPEVAPPQELDLGL